jgi:uncharacterized membrane protein YbaN (DUF454 family)
MLPLAWKLVAIVALGLAALASVLPVLPSVPFLLLAAVAAGRGWPWLERKLSRHRQLGPLVAAWRERGALPRVVKLTAIASLFISGALVWLSPARPSLAIAVDSGLVCFGAWLWTRPSI